MTNETKAKIKGIITVRNVSIVAAVLLVICSISFYSIGKNSKISDDLWAESKKKDVEISEKNKTLVRLEREINKNETKIEEQEADFKQLEDYLINKEKLDAETSEAEKNLETLNNTIAEKQTEIDSKNAQLDSLTSAIIKAKAAPVTLPAGQFTVGKDIEPGRYSVSGDSNFQVWSSYGDLKVNTILGGGNFGVESYVCELNSGDKIEAGASNKYTPVE